MMDERSQFNQTLLKLQIVNLSIYKIQIILSTFLYLNIETVCYEFHNNKKHFFELNIYLLEFHFLQPSFIFTMIN